MLIVRGTRTFLERTTAGKTADGHGTTLLGDWYATWLSWKPQAALFVNERTLLPVLVPFAPASGVVPRFLASLDRVLHALGVPEDFIQAEVEHMNAHRLARTMNRSVVGVMNEFAFLAGAFTSGAGTTDLVGLSLRLSETPCGPLSSRCGSPDRELAALVEAGDRGRTDG